MIAYLKTANGTILNDNKGEIMAVERYTPTIGNADWNIKELSKEERAKLKDRLVLGLITNERDYQTVIGYLYKKYPHEMDGVTYNGKDNVAIQWNYSVAKNKLVRHNNITNEDHDMYALVVYDKERDYEPVMFAGSYFKLASALDDSNLNNSCSNYKDYLCDADGNNDPNGKYQAVGHGYVMFCDPDYRRLGLATDLWWAEAQLYREALNIRFQREIQNEYSLESTKKMFSDSSKCIITSPGRLKADGTRCQIRVLLDYEDIDVIKGFENMSSNMKEIYGVPHWEFLHRENFTVDELIKPWNK